MHATNIDPHAHSVVTRHVEPDWRAIDDAIIALARTKSELDVEIGSWLIAALNARVDRRCGFGSFAEFVERRLGYDTRTLKEKLRVARALEQLPRLRELVHAGQRSWSAAREISRVATAETEAEWIAATERRTDREIETMVAGRRAGDLPSHDKDPLLVKRRFDFEVETEQFALICEAFERLRSRIGPSATNTEALVAMAEEVLWGTPEGRASHQTSLTICAACERTWTRAGGEMIEVSPAHAACARCDGELVGFFAGR